MHFDKKLPRYLFFISTSDFNRNIRCSLYLFFYFSFSIKIRLNQISSKKNIYIDIYICIYIYKKSVRCGERSEWDRTGNPWRIFKTEKERNHRMDLPRLISHDLTEWTGMQSTDRTTTSYYDTIAHGWPLSPLSGSIVVDSRRESTTRRDFLSFWYISIYLDTTMDARTRGYVYTYIHKNLQKPGQRPSFENR